MVMDSPEILRGVIVSWKTTVDKKIVPTSLKTPAIESVTTDVLWMRL